MKFLSKIILGLSVIFLCGCTGGGEDRKQINFDSFSMNISEKYEKETNTSSIENKQIIGSILKAYKSGEDEENSDFKENLIISRTDTKEKINSSRFSKINITKLNKKMAGYSLIEKEQFSFNCQGEDIKHTIHTFSTPKKIFEGEKTVYITQSYFTYGTNGYIISFSTDAKENTQNFKDQLKTINCN